MAYAVILISPWNVQVYSLYPISDQIVLGWTLLLTGPILTIGVAYVIARNPVWLSGFSGPAKPTQRKNTVVNDIRIPKLVVPFLTLLLLFVLAGYFTYAAFAVTSGPVASGGSIVYINETPVSWQYSPQEIKVVLGINSTVTWVSHSVSYDTVTGDSDRGGPCGSGFSSCPIAPGQSYSFAFTEPGTYDYHCLYHQWMVGTVVVLQSA